MFHKSFFGLFAMLPAMAAAIVPSFAADNPPPGAVPLTASELTAIYSGKTWVWSNGGGAYTAPDGTFIAASIDGLKQSYANGRWFVATKGRLCWQATWYGRYSGYPARSCFQHVESDGVIYQRGYPKGDWGIFAHNPALTYDSINYVKDGDLVEPGYAAAKAFLHRKDIHQPPEAFAPATGGKP